MTELERFDYGPLSASIRVVRQGGQPMFLLVDLARALGYRDSEKAKRHLRDSQYKTLERGVSSDLGLNRGRLPFVVSEAGMYRLALRSGRPEADAFQDWVTDEVLPALRTKGFYVAPDATVEQLDRAKIDIEALRQKRLLELTDYVSIRKLIKAARGEGRDYADVQNWLYLGLFGSTAKTIVMARKQLTPGEAKVAKNYLTESELERLNGAVLIMQGVLKRDYPEGTAPLAAIKEAARRATA